MDHANLPDPVREDIQNLQASNSALTNRLLELEDMVTWLRRELERANKTEP